MMRLRAIQAPAVRREIEAVLAKYMARLAAEDRALEQVQSVVYLARRGFGFHHAGLLPILKQLVEELFSRALMRVVFATDTLALGINMPARSVVVGRMSKWDGVSRRPLIPNEFQQMAGRAGRRGIDPQGYVIMPYSPFVPFRDALGIATGPLYPVESAFTVRYNTILNLWDPPKGERMLAMMRHSLLQFQQSRRLRDLERDVEEWQVQVDSIPEGCLIGLPDGENLLSEYEALGRAVETARTREKKLAEARARLELRRTETPWRRPDREVTRRLLRTFPVGGVLHLVPLGWAVYLGPGESGPGLFWVGDRITAVSEYRQIDYIPPERPQVSLPEEIFRLVRTGAGAAEAGQELPTSLDARQWMAAQLAGLNLPDLDEWIAQHQATTLTELDDQLAQMDAQIAEAREYTRRVAAEERAHACHTCPVRKQHRTYRRQRGRALAGYDAAVQTLEERRHYEDTRLQTLLDGLVAVLKQFYYLDAAGNPTPKAPRLMDIFDTNALMISELLESGYLAGASPSDLAEIFSWFAYDRDVEIRNRHLLPGHLLRIRDQLDQLQRAVFQAERRYELMISTGYNVFFYGAARAWCKGATMADLLQKMDLSEGDLVMTFNKTLDLMRQVRDMLYRQDPENPLREGLREADALLRRGVVELVYSLGFVPGEQPADVGSHSSGATVVAPEEAALQQQEAAQLDVVGQLALEGISDEPYDLERVPRPRREPGDAPFRGRPRPPRSDGPPGGSGPRRPPDRPRNGESRPPPRGRGGPRRSGPRR
jgi:ATP-dependent RNA helicase HelY